MIPKNTVLSALLYKSTIHWFIVSTALKENRNQKKEDKQLRKENSTTKINNERLHTRKPSTSSRTKNSMIYDDATDQEKNDN